jgi:YidC/Oxa1 family membrane protein insertase
VILLSVLTPVEDVLTWALEEFHTTFGLSWAWSVIAVTVVVRMLLVPLTVRQIHSMQRMQQYLPQMKELQKRYKADRKKQNEELMKFYKEHQINPASSCLPILPQIPIFFALYFVLRDFDEEIFPKYTGAGAGGESADALRWLEFVPSITANITDHWSGYVLLAVYVASQVASTWYMPMATTSQAQRYIFLALPFVFALFIINPPVGAEFPVGLLLYWMTTNLWTVGQGIVTRRLREQIQPVTAKRSSRTPPKKAQPPAGEGSQAPAEAKGQKPQQARRVKRKKKRARR